MYRIMTAMDVRPGEWVFHSPRDMQVKETVTGVDLASPDRLLTEMVYADGSFAVLPATAFVLVAEPELKRPELTLIPQAADPGWSRYHRNRVWAREVWKRMAEMWRGKQVKHGD